MLFQASIRQELARSFSACFVVLTTIVMTATLIHTLGEATQGAVNPADVIQLMGYVVLGRSPMILTLSVFVAVVFTLSRMARDHELIVWFTAGQGWFNLLKPCLQFAWPIWILIAVITLLVWPWSSEQINRLRNEYENRGDVERVAPGQFQASANGSKVFFIDKNSNVRKGAEHVFIAAFAPNREVLTSAQSATTQTQNGKHLLVLKEGVQIKTDIKTQETEVNHFSEYGQVLDTGNNSLDETLPTRALTTWRLIHSSDSIEQGELAWRISLVLVAMNLVGIALLVVRVETRLGNSAHLALALLAFITYYNLIGTSYSLVGGHRLSFWEFLLWLHASVLVLTGIGIYWKHKH